MRVIIAGSRGFNDYETLYTNCEEAIHKDPSEEIVIISGGAKGADKLGESYAKSKGYKLEIYPANWDAFGKSAGYKRNEQMAEKADCLIAFWDGTSKGTKHMIDIARRKKLRIFIVSV
jgi:predicted Rossmann fold nucleotide-binding protein DprA/Smf involved in DNA uptake